MSSRPLRPARLAPLGWHLLAAGASLVVAVGCSARHYDRRADRRAERILGERLIETLSDREATVRRPEALPDPGPEATPVARERRVLSLAESLEIAVRHNREYRGRQEDLYLQALSLADVRHGFSPQLNATLSYLFADAEGLPSAEDVGFDASIDQILPWGGRIGLDLRSDYEADAGDPGGGYTSGAGIRLTQPLLRGAGRAVSHEPLIQAERNLVYAIRSFELFREDFTIEVARRYYDLVQQLQSTENLRQNLAGFVFGRAQAEALFQVGRTNELDVLRARRSELQSRDSLIAAEENYELGLDRFRIFLGLPFEDQIDVLPADPPFYPLEFDSSQAVEIALANRLDLLNREEQLEDARRALSLAKINLRPDLDLSAGYDFSTEPSGSLSGQDSGDGSWSAGVTLSLPLDRVRESNSYRRSRVVLIQAKRALEEFEDNLRVEIESAFRELERRRQSLEIQRQLITDQEKNVRIARLRFENGDFSNRDVVEAEEALLDARNSLINEQVNYEIARLQLLRDLGILFIDDQGMWKE